MLRVSDNKRSLQLDNKPFFYLADTVWSAFTNIELNDWAYYLDKRKEQGFNVLQINIMPQWDRSVTKEVVYPFEVEDQYFNINKMDEHYFDHAEKMLEIAQEKGFIPALVLLWSNYLPETWAGNMEKTPYFRKQDVRTYTEKMVNRFKKYNPIYLISGDTDFLTENVVDYYLRCLEATQANDADSLKVLHIKRGLKDIPEKLLNHPDLDMYFYQSGHNLQYQNVAYEFADYFYNESPIRPTINSEPCYELISYSRNLYGRFSREDVRKAAWQSILSGAFAGIAYGAHGIWSWHEVGSVFGSDLGEGFAPPYNWRTALNFEGANDYGFLKEFFTKENLVELKPNQEYLINDIADIRISESEDKIYIYLPVNIPLSIKGVFESSTDYAIDLENKVNIPIKKKASEGITKIEMTSIIKDSVIVLKK
ncbi:apiosidase-like domain-containing protein [Marinilactibacillus piezotolerans]|uniref:apiosidase-like domain-containing protein n=1 Tax=Marinilactibacillus piezotolerans TaxID=258723 RepID=UPI0009B111D2|nr:DUF4038 domain-containing protein [Marinilactibacillus piezotolerans]